MTRTRPPKPAYWSVPRMWPGATVVILAGGPSRTPAACELVKAARFSEVGERRIKVIAINSAYRMAPWADVLYGCDARWWRWNPAALAVPSLKVTLAPETAAQWPDIKLLGRDYAEGGLSSDPTQLRTNKNSGCQAINFAALAGGARLLLAGFDLRKVDDRWHADGEHPIPWSGVEPPVFLPRFATLLPDLAALGVAVVNCTPGSALTCFPIGDLAEELDRAIARVADPANPHARVPAIA